MEGGPRPPAVRGRAGPRTHPGTALFRGRDTGPVARRRVPEGSILYADVPSSPSLGVWGGGGGRLTDPPTRGPPSTPDLVAPVPCTSKSRVGRVRGNTGVPRSGLSTGTRTSESPTTYGSTGTASSSFGDGVDSGRRNPTGTVTTTSPSPGGRSTGSSRSSRNPSSSRLPTPTRGWGGVGRPGVWSLVRSPVGYMSTVWGWGSGLGEDRG